MRLTALAWHNLTRRPFRSALTAAGVGIAVGGFVCLSGVTGGVAHAWNGGMVQRGAHLVALRAGSVEILATSLPESMADELAREPGVRDAAGELVNLAILESGDTALVSGWAPGSFLWDSLPLVAGRLPRDGEAALAEALAREQHLRPGDSILLEGRLVPVVGTFKAPGALLSSGIVLTLRSMQDLWSRPGAVTFLLARLERPGDRSEVTAVLERLRKRFPGLRISESERVAEDNRVLDILSALNRTTSGVALLMALVVVLNTLLMAVAERTREFGVLSALGWPARRILASITLEGVLLSIAGGLAGSLLGIAGLRWIATASALRGFIDPAVGAVEILEATIAAAALGALGALYPAWRAIRLDPVAALRSE